MQVELNWITSRARLSGDNIAVIDGETNQVYTYEQLDYRSNSLAYSLQNMGVKKGDRLAILSPNDVSYLDLLFACIKLNAIFVPLNWRLAKEEIEWILNDSEPACVFCHSDYTLMISDFARFSVITLHTEQYKSMVSGNRHPVLFEEQHERDALAMIYTGGTTGKPKGVILSHQSILWNAMNTIISWNLTKDDTTLTVLPMFHTGGLNALTIPILLMGGKVVLAQLFTPEKATRLLEQHQCTIVLFVPTMYQSFINSHVFTEHSYPSMKLFLSGGAPCPAEIYDAFKEKGILFKEGYGLTEAGPNNFYIDPEMAYEKRGSVGKPMLFNDAKIINDEGKEAKANEIGELWVKGKHGFELYWNNLEATVETKNDGWIATGDLAKKDEEGYYYIVGRKKDLIITGGENVYPLEVEQCLLKHPSILEAAVVGIPDMYWGEKVTGFLVVKDGSCLDDKEITDFCAQYLGKYKIPKTYHIVAELPKTHVGKIDKKRLKEMGIHKVRE
ncbi:fatty-acyl-CoA synthase [Bacillus oleivorans]|uniref:Fatty-acyl-CoA synthase n=1 Tax=Bacillus oleivorans TaxID=1448271 RepID=A0A285CRA4_9BACI|nr:long-chain fatty acid--CoA ligase [Bacillus oleivorans]SNX70061.1 fatty-acyl-CoA synthase [Bacillus oleivorans]